MANNEGLSTLSTYLRKLKEDRETGSQNSLNFYLKKIREITKDQDDPRAVHILQKSINTAEQTRQEHKKSKTETREDIRKNRSVETAGTVSTTMLGRMLFYQYYAKTRDKLPYWDRFPVMFPISTDGKSMLGMNLHYLDPINRARLMAALMTLANTVKLDPRTKLLMTYKLLNGTSKFIWYRPCIKRYLFSHIRSRIVVINPEEWTSVLFMPVADWQKSTEDVVWRDSIRKVMKHRQGSK